MFPSSATRQNYARLRLELLKAELDIMLQFKMEENGLYQTMDRLEVQKASDQKSPVRQVVFPLLSQAI